MQPHALVDLKSCQILTFGLTCLKGAPICRKWMELRARGGRQRNSLYVSQWWGGREQGRWEGRPFNELDVTEHETLFCLLLLGVWVKLFGKLPSLNESYQNRLFLFIANISLFWCLPRTTPPVLGLLNSQSGFLGGNQPSNKRLDLSPWLKASQLKWIPSV